MILEGVVSPSWEIVCYDWPFISMFIMQAKQHFLVILRKFLGHNLRIQVVLVSKENEKHDTFICIVFGFFRISDMLIPKFLQFHSIFLLFLLLAGISRSCLIQVSMVVFQSLFWYYYLFKIPFPTDKGEKSVSKKK